MATYSNMTSFARNGSASLYQTNLLAHAAYMLRLRVPCAPGTLSANVPAFVNRRAGMRTTDTYALFICLHPKSSRVPSAESERNI